MIEVTDLQKNFGPKRVLRGVNARIEEGKVFTVIGGSGVGKSTFIKCIIRLHDPDGGMIKVDGVDVTHVRDEYRIAGLRSKFGYLFQEGALFDSLSVWENVAFGLKYLTDIPKKRYRDIAREKLALVGLSNVEDLRPSELSGGMKKRVSLARAIASNPKYILYDEPTSGLDPIMSDVINDLILHLKDTIGATSIVITHDMKSAFKISDTISMIYEGQFIFTGTSSEFETTDNPYVRQFVEGSSKGPIQMKIKKFD